MKILECLAVIIVFWALRTMFMRQILRKRQNLNTEELKTLFGCDDRGILALNLISEMYSLRPGYLRPDDSFSGKSFLTQYDSWSINEGYCKVKRYVKQRKMTLDSKWTVADFMAWHVSIGD